MINLKMADLSLCVKAIGAGMVSADEVYSKLQNAHENNTLVSASGFNEFILQNEILSEQQLTDLRSDSAQSLAGLSPLDSMESSETMAQPSSSRPQQFTGEQVAVESSTHPQSNSDSRLPHQGQRYSVIEAHASGGLGEVYRARDNELDREVALKQIRKRFANDKGIRDRFLFEARVTGYLEHSGVVPVYGMTVDENGKPAYAMRFIEGRTFNEAIKDYHESKSNSDTERQLAFRKLLNQLVTVCYTIDFAHSQNVLHRDLKPENIMLGSYGETLVVDWGIAKLISKNGIASMDEAFVTNIKGETEKYSGTKTKHGSAIGTPGYMSPEQSLGWNDTLTAQSDIYSLGVILYSLLAGASPFSDASSFEDFQTRAQIGKYRDVRQSNQATPKALAFICKKAMAIKPKERYKSARHMALDLEAFLADEPIKAMDETTFTRLGRWVRKNKSFVLTLLAAAFLLSALSFLTAFLVNQQRKVANNQKDLALKLVDEKEALILEKEELTQSEIQARKNAEASFARSTRVLDFMVGILRSPDPVLFDGRRITVAQVLDKAVEDLQSNSELEPGEKAMMLEAIAKSYDGLGLPDKARSPAEKSLDLTSLEYEESDQEYLDRLLILAVFCRKQGDYEEALKLFEKRIELEKPTTDAEVMSEYGSIFFYMGNISKAKEIWTKVYQVRVDAHGPEELTAIDTLNNLGMCESNLGNNERAIEMYQEVCAVYADEYGDDDTRTMVVKNNLAVAHLYLEEWEPAIELLENAVEIQTDRLGELHPSTIESMINLAAAYDNNRDKAQAYRILEKLRRMVDSKASKLPVMYIHVLNNLMSMYMESGDFDQAIEIGLQLNKLAKSFHVNHRIRTNVPNAVSTVLLSIGKFKTAEEICRDYLEAMPVLESGPGLPGYLRIKMVLAEALIEQNELEEAERLLVQVTELAPKEDDGEDREFAYLKALRGLVAFHRDDLETAEGLLTQCHVTMIADLWSPFHYADNRRSFQWMIGLHERLGNEKQVGQLKQELEKFNSENAFEYPEIE